MFVCGLIMFHFFRITKVILTFLFLDKFQLWFWFFLEGMKMQSLRDRIGDYLMWHICSCLSARLDLCKIPREHWGEASSNHASSFELFFCFSWNICTFAWQTVRYARGRYKSFLHKVLIDYFSLSWQDGQECCWRCQPSAGFHVMHVHSFSTEVRSPSYLRPPVASRFLWKVDMTWIWEPNRFCRLVRQHDTTRAKMKCAFVFRQLFKLFQWLPTEAFNCRAFRLDSPDNWLHCLSHTQSVRERVHNVNYFEWKEQTLCELTEGF